MALRERAAPHPLCTQQGFAPTGWSGIGPVCGPFGQVDGPRVSPAHPTVSRPLSPLPRARRPDLFSACAALVSKRGGPRPGAPLPQVPPCPHCTSQAHCKSAAGHPPAPRPVNQDLLTDARLRAVLQGLKSTVFSRAGCRADAPARRHAWLTRGPLGEALLGLFGFIWLRVCMVARGSNGQKNERFAWPWGRGVSRAGACVHGIALTYP